MSVYSLRCSQHSGNVWSVIHSRNRVHNHCKTPPSFNASLQVSVHALGKKKLGISKKSSKDPGILRSGKLAKSNESMDRF